MKLVASKVWHCYDHWSLQPPRRRSSSERCESLDRCRGFTSAESAAQKADFAVLGAENGIRLDPAWGLSVEAISARFSSLKPSLLSPHSTIRKSRRASESLRHSLAAGIICTPNQSHLLFLSQLPIHASLFLATPPLRLNDFAFRKIVDRCARKREKANSVSDHGLPDVYRLPGIESLLCDGQCLGAEDARDSQTGEAK
jgi:hypothetical protein